MTYDVSCNQYAVRQRMQAVTQTREGEGKTRRREREGEAHTDIGRDAETEKICCLVPFRTITYWYLPRPELPVSSADPLPLKGGVCWGLSSLLFLMAREMQLF